MAAAVGIVSALSGVVSGVMGFMNGSYEAAVADRNAQVAQMNSDRSNETGLISAEDNDLKNKALLGEQESQQAASGVSVSGASEIQTRKSAAALGRRDTLNIINAAQVDSYNYLTQKQSFEAQAQVSRLNAGASLISGALGGIGGYLGASKATASPLSLSRPNPLFSFGARN